MRTALFGLLLVFALAGCAPREPAVQQRQFFAFGTLVELTLVDPDPERAARAADRVEQAFNDYHRLWHAWHPGPLADLNAALAAGTPHVPDPSLLPLLKRAAPLAEQSGYRFDPAIGGLSALWGFHGDEPPQGPPPQEAALARWRADKPSYADLEWRGDALVSRNPAVQLDFGAFAKGYAVDLAIAQLREAGIANAIINAGGDLRAIGNRGTRPWRIGIRHPRSPEVLASVEVSGDESVFTSGDYERFFEYEGRRYHHILDPSMGEPATGTTSVTVIHPDAAEADAAATALFVAGPDHWHEVAAALGVHYVMLIDDAGVAHMNPAMARRIRFEIPDPPEVRLSAPLP